MSSTSVGNVVDDRASRRAAKLAKDIPNIGPGRRLTSEESGPTTLVDISQCWRTLGKH